MTDRVRFGYVPYSANLSQPGDRRRFPFYAARRGISFEVARPDREYDIVVLSSRADLAHWPHTPRPGPKLVYELIDSYLSVPRWQPRSLLRGVAKFAARETSRPVLDYRRAMEAMCRRADAVVCSTAEQQLTYRRFNDNVHVILDAHAELGAARKRDHERGETLHLVWEGLPHTVGAFDTIGDVLRTLDRESPVALHLVTDLEYAKYAWRFGRRSTKEATRGLVPATYLYEWNTHTLPAIVTACDIAVIPLDLDDPFSRGKPENKLLLLWRLGMPSVTAASPAYERAMAGAGIDLTCRSPDDWYRNLRQLRDDDALRADAGAAGLAYVESEHDEARLLQRWDALFSSVLDGN